ncbi:MAG: alkyl sulfatase dimerization domain-containing protein [Lachnospiraceae bacterium]
MGSSVDQYGREVTIGTDSNGQVGNQDLIDWNAQFTPKLDKITDTVYAANGYGLANSIMIEGDTGIIIIDTNDSIEAAQMELEQYRKITDKPISGIIYTHWHYVSGTEAYIPADNPDNVPIIANERLPEQMAGAISEVASSYADRVSRHHGVYLPEEGEDAIIGCGLGSFYANPLIENPTQGYIAPNTFIKEGESQEMTIDGVDFVFTAQASDSEDGLIIWLPEEKVCINNLTWPTMPNLYTLRGEVYRDPRVWIDGLDKVLAYEPEHVLTTHGLPLSGKDVIQKEVTLQRDSLQFIFDQTVRYMNKGYSIDQIVESVKMPEYLVSGMITQPYYGEVNHYIRGVYRGLIGWFSTDTVELNAVTPEFEAMKIIDGFGGADMVMEQAKATLEDKQYSWAAQLATYVMYVEPENEEAIQLKADALRAMGQLAPATTSRNYYLSQARELEGVLDYSRGVAVSADKLLSAPRDTFLKMLRVSIDPEKSSEIDRTFKVTFTDKQDSYGLIIRNGVGQVVYDPESADVEMKLPYDTLISVLVGEKNFSESIQSGEIVIEGDMEVFQEIMSAFDIAL